MDRRVRATRDAVLHSVLAVLVALTGLVCAQASVAAPGPAPSTAVAQHMTAADDGAETAGSGTVCSGSHDADAEAPHAERAPVDASAAALSAHRPDTVSKDASRAPGRAGPAPPPRAPSLEALSVLRV